MRRRAVAVAVAAVLAGTAVVGHPVSAAEPVLGSGSTFVEVALDTWGGDVYLSDGLSVEYSGSGSLRGLENFQSGVVDFAASDVAYAPGTDGRRAYRFVPIVAGGIALPYNLVDPAGVRITDLRLSPTLIADLFFGNIRNWRDQRVVAENPSLADRLPDQEVRLAVRTSGSGTTGVVTDFLSTAAPDRWADFVARSGAQTLDDGNYLTDWPESGGGFLCHCSQFAGSNEIANYIAQDVPASRGSIGYVETAYAVQLGLPVARVRNAAGNHRLPTARDVAVALLGATENGDGTQDLEGVHLNPRAEAYPISSYSYAVVPADDSAGFSVGKGETLSRYLIYSVTAGQRTSAVLGYSPLPPNLVQVALDRISVIPGAVEVPPLGDWGRFYEALAVDPAGTYTARYADATVTRGGTDLRVAPGTVDDRGTVRDELEVDLRHERCRSRTLEVTEVALRLTGPDLGGVSVDPRAGAALVAGVYTLTGRRTSTPAGRGCRTPDPSAATVVPVDLALTLIADWRVARGSTPVEYGGTDCGGSGTCYVRDASARVSWSSELGASRARSSAAFLFEGVYPIGGAP